MIDATTEIVVGLDCRGHPVARQLRCEAPLLARVVAGSGDALHLAMVGGAAGPIGGDRLRLRLVVETGARVVVRSVAASIVQPGPRHEISTLHTELVVEPLATLAWLPQPTVSVAGSAHRSTITLDASSTANVRVCEAVTLGRHAEPPGHFRLRERVTIDGDAVLDHETEFAPGTLLGPGAHGPARTYSTEVVIGTPLPGPAVTVGPDCLSSTVHLSPLCALVVSRY